MMKRIPSMMLLSLLLVVGSVQAQEQPRDPRPLQGLDRSSIPTLTSVPTLVQARSLGGLLQHATVVDTAQLVMQPVVRRTPAQKIGLRTVIPALGRVVRAANGTVRWMEGNLGRIDGGAGKQAAQTAQAARAVLVPHASVLRLREPDEELRLMRAERDALGYVHARFEQVYAGLPVWGRDLYVHVDDRGEVYAINGTYEPTPAAVATVPALSEEAALHTVISRLQAEQRWKPVPDDVARWLDIDAPRTTLVLYPDAAAGLRLAYEVTLHPNLLEWYTYLVDAQDGRVLNRIARHCTLWHEAPLREVPGVASRPPAPRKSSGTGTFANASAPDLNGQLQQFRVYEHDDGLFYQVWDLQNLNAAQSQLPDSPAGGALTISANDTDFNENAQLTHVTSNDNTWNDPAGVSAHVNMEAAYTYYQTAYARDAIDGRDQSIISVIHVTDGGQPMENAFWNGRVMAYGDGGQVFKPLAGGLDVAGHEMSHGVIQHTADLIYQFQSGALNESFADVFGAMVDRDDLLMGEDIMRQHLALRDLLNPDNSQVLSRQPAHMNQYQNLGADQDNGGVHINSGIPNRAAALVIQSLGRNRAEQIYYRALDSYLTRNSQFGDARMALERAAIDLHGQGSAELAAVQQAFDAVGIFDTSGTGGEEGNDLPVQTGGQSLITFLTEDGSIGLLDMTDPNNLSFGFFAAAGAAARVDVVNEDRAQLSTSLDGERIWFVNAQNRLAFIEIATGAVSVFEDLNIQQDGDLWTASVAPDESVVALVSAYFNDPTLYFYFLDSDELFSLPLEPETTQDGIQNETIQFPDVVSWSPNPQVPRIAFDALNAVPDFGLSSEATSYWSMYEINFESEAIYNLIPAQPTNLSVGNVTYANTEPDLLAFNVLDETGTWDVLVSDLAEGEFFVLDIPSFTLGGVPITDAQRPTFSPDDGQLAFTSPEHGVMLFFDGTTGTLTFLEIGGIRQPLYNARWFVRGGSGGTSNQTPTARFTASPTTGTAPILVEVDASASSDPDGDPLTYRWDFGDGSAGGGRTAQHTFAAKGTFTVTLTVTDSGGLSSTASQVIEVPTATAVEEESELPRAVALHPNYPNPFNPSTVLRYDLPAPAEVTLEVVDLLGRRVALLEQGPQPAGRHEVRFEASDLPSGIYLARLTAGGVVQTRHMMFLK